MGDIPEAPKLEPLILSSLSEDEVKWLNTWIETYSSSKQETQEKKEKEILFWRQPSLVNPKLFPFIEYPFVWDLEEHRKTDGSDYLRRKIFVTKESIDNIVVQCAIGCIKQDSLEEYFSSDLINSGGDELRMDLAKNLLIKSKNGSFLVTKGYKAPFCCIIHYFAFKKLVYTNYLETCFQQCMEQKFHSILIHAPGREHLELFINFIVGWIFVHGWTIERIYIVVDSDEDEKEYTELFNAKLPIKKRIHENLPPLEPPTLKTHLGPTNTSNWVIQNRIIAGAYPSHTSPEEQYPIMESILSAGVTTFVCLQTIRELGRFAPYKNVALNLRDTLAIQKDIQFISFPIIDGNVVPDYEIKRLIVELAWRIMYNDEVLYIHCWGGHGRTGTVVASLLGKLYNLDASEALKYTSDYHDMRVPKRSKSPQTVVQFDQVKRVLGKSSPFTIFKD